MATVAPMLAKLGYDPNANPPNYGLPDTMVVDNTRKVIENSHLWEAKALELLKPQMQQTSSTSA